MADYTREELDTKLNELASDKQNEFQKLSDDVRQQINSLRQFIRSDSSELQSELDHIQPFERDISMETRPQLNQAGLKDQNKHISHLSNHELHQIKSVNEKDHSRKIQTVLDEPLGLFLDKTINFLTYSIDDFHLKIYEAELMENIGSEDKGMYNTLKIYTVAMILFIRDKENILYIGCLMIFLSIIIYFISIVSI